MRNLEAKSGNDALQNFREYRQKIFITLSRFWPLSGSGFSVNPLKKENFWQKSLFRYCWMKLKKVVKNGICWYKNSCKTTRQKRTFYKKYIYNLKYNVKLAFIFHFILLGIPSSFHCLLGTGGGKFYVTDKICLAWRTLFVDDPLVQSS